MEHLFWPISDDGTLEVRATLKLRHLGLSIQKLYPKAALLLNILYGCLDLQV